MKTTEEVEQELEKMLNALSQTNISLGIYDLPPRIKYDFIYEMLQEMTFVPGPKSEWAGFIMLDGCSGYCPGCVQRPWCGAGQDLCWSEDEKAGKMALPEALKDYVSASPQSLDLLKESDRTYEESGSDGELPKNQDGVNPLYMPSDEEEEDRPEQLPPNWN